MNIVALLEPYVTEILKACEDFFKDVTQLSMLEQKVSDSGNRLSAGILSSILTELDRTVRENYARKKEYSVQRKDLRSLISTVGDVTFQSTLYRKKDSGEYLYLTEKLLHLPRHERFTAVAEARVLGESTVYSYQHAADRLSIGDQKISKSAVMNKVHAIDAALQEDELPEEEEKRKCEYLYIEADEDHIHRQKDGEEEGCFIGKLVYLFEGKKETCKGRRRLMHPFYFSGLYPGAENGCLWKKVEQYIEKHYDLDCLKRVYINSDGGGWIKVGKDYIYKACLVADRFHLMKYINRVCNLTGDMAGVNKGRFYKYIWKKNLTAVEELLDKIEREYGSARSIDKARTFFVNNWDAICRAFHDKHALGCSAEGHVSNVLSDRMSSRPMGWSKVGSDHMCKLRCYVQNHGKEKVVDLVRWRREKVFQEQYAATGTDGFAKELPVRRFTKQQREAYTYIEKMQATLGKTWTVRKALAIREQLGNI